MSRAVARPRARSTPRRSWSSPARSSASRASTAPASPDANRGPRRRLRRGLVPARGLPRRGAAGRAGPPERHRLARREAGRAARACCSKGHTDVVTEGDPGRVVAPAVRRRHGGRSHLRPRHRRHEERARRRHGRRRRLQARRGHAAGQAGRGRARGRGGRHDRRPPPLRAPRSGRELDAAIICEPEENELCLEQRGVVWARFRVRGKMAHGAMPEAGVNPITGARRHAGRGARRSSGGCGRPARRAAISSRRP